MTFVNVVYVDPSIALGGDGTAPATALKDLPSVTALANDTMYLIRRTANTSYCNITGMEENSTLLRVGLVGMPLSSDARYEAMPAAAKTAWGADAATKAQIRVDGNNCWPLTACYDFELYNVNFERSAVNEVGQWSAAICLDSSTNRRSEVGITDTDLTYYGAVNIENCRFAGVGEPIDDMTYTTAPTQGLSCNYFSHTGKASDVAICNNVINLTSVNDIGMGCCGIGFVFHDVMSSFYIVNNNGYGITIGTSTVNDDGYGGNAVFIYQIRYSNAVRLDVRNNAFKIRRSSGYTYPSAIYTNATSYGYHYANIVNNSYTEGDHFSTPAHLNIQQPLFALRGTREIIVDNLSVVLPDCWGLTSYGAVYLSGSSDRGNGSWNEHKSAKNITVTLADAGAGTGDKTPINCVDSTNGDYYDDYTALSLIYFDVAENITVVNTEGRAVHFEYINNLIGTNVIKGCVNVCRTYGTIQSITTTRPHMALRCEYSVVSVGTITVGTEAGSLPVVYFYRPEEFEQCNIFIGSINKQAAASAALWPSDTNSREDHIGGFLQVANNGATGRTTIYHKWATCDTWAATRSGSSAAAVLKFQNTTRESRSALAIGAMPGLIQVTPSATAGKHRVTVYIAYSDFTRFDDKFWIELLSDKGTYDSRLHGVWFDDNSIWTGVGDGMTLKKWVCDITLAEAGPINAHAFFRGFSATGVLYLDPVFVIS